MVKAVIATKRADQQLPQHAACGKIGMNRDGCSQASSETGAAARLSGSRTTSDRIAAVRLIRRRRKAGHDARLVLLPITPAMAPDPTANPTPNAAPSRPIPRARVAGVVTSLM